eukprot:4060041-Prorocentrum_lima.AAC.1
MTSSLVGSEMCIRDRIWGRRSPDSGTPTTTNPLPLTTTRSASGQSHTTCLLYTSDAADDM